jgi:hypothetical protein
MLAIGLRRSGSGLGEATGRGELLLLLGRGGGLVERVASGLRVGRGASVVCLSCDNRCVSSGGGLKFVWSGVVWGGRSLANRIEIPSDL